MNGSIVKKKRGRERERERIYVWRRPAAIAIPTEKKERKKIGPWIKEKIVYTRIWRKGEWKYACVACMQGLYFEWDKNRFLKLF